MSRTLKVIFILSLVANLAIVYVAYKALEYRAHINYFLDKYTHVVDEFSGRRVYEEDNKQYRTDTTISNRVVFIGSQLTEQWDVKKFFPAWEGINRGISGQRMSGFILRFVPDVIELHPQAVVIEFASYNFRSQYTLKELEDYITIMATVARANHIEPILTTVIPPRSYLEYEGYSVVDSVLRFNDWLRNFCRDNSYQFADFQRLLTGENALLPDSVAVSDIELNENGYRLISETTTLLLKKVAISQ